MVMFDSIMVYFFWVFLDNDLWKLLLLIKWMVYLKNKWFVVVRNKMVLWNGLIFFMVFFLLMLWCWLCEKGCLKSEFYLFFSKCLCLWVGFFGVFCFFVLFVCLCFDLCKWLNNVYGDSGWCFRGYVNVNGNGGRGSFCCFFLSCIDGIYYGMLYFKCSRFFV